MLNYLRIIICVLIIKNGFSQINNNDKKDSLKSVFCGTQAVFNYSYKTTHLAITFNLFLKKHCIYLGPEYTKILINPPVGDPVNKYDTNSLGLNLGYRYLFNTNFQRLFGFLQFNYAIYKNSYNEHQLGPPGITKRNRILVENTGTIGLNYKLNKKIFINSSIGIGSFAGFFLIFVNVIPSIYFGIEYR